MLFRLLAVAAFVAVVWGLCFVLIQASLPTAAPLLLAAIRSLTGAGVLYVWLAAARRGPRTGEKPTRLVLPSARMLFLAAMLNCTLAFGAMYLAAGRTEASVASILSGGQPVMLAAAGWVMFGERVALRAVAGLMVAMLGVILVASASSGSASLEGATLALVAAAAPAAGTVLMRRIDGSIDVPAATAAQFLLGGAVLLGASALVEPWSRVAWSASAIMSLVVLGVLGTGVAYVAWFWLLGRLSLVRLGAILYLVPVVGVVASVLAGDRPPTAEVAGLVAMLIGMAVASLPRGDSVSRTDLAPIIDSP